ncbi:MAG: hypothetical protein ACT4QC_05950 [Planctomycetaceae bacterium]
MTPLDELIVLIPSHGLEDFPTELAENDAASLLNSFAVAWHPALLAAARRLPRFQRADEPPAPAPNCVVFLPAPCEGSLPCGWADNMAAQGSTVVRGAFDRPTLIAAAIAAIDPRPAIDPDWVADFLALGFCHIQIEVLTRKMRHFGNVDTANLEREALAAAQAALAGDAETVRTRLRTCFEILREARERFYPVDCYLLDLCLLIPRLADRHLQTALAAGPPLSVLATAHDLAEIAETAPEAGALLKEAAARGVVDFVCGDWREQPLPLMPLNSIIWQLEHAQRLVAEAYGVRPVVWGRRRYGLFPQLPQLLRKAAFAGALHVVLDDGIYPDAEYTKLRWEGIDGTPLDALTRIPLAADAAVSFLRLPDRLAESMDNDHVAGIIFARWPEVNCPFFEDLHRIHRYAPVLGRFVTLTEFFTKTESPTRHSKNRPQEYLTPYLFQAVARQERDPISRYAGRFERRTTFDSAMFLSGVQQVLLGLSPQPVADLEEMIEGPSESASPEEIHAAVERLDNHLQRAAQQLAELMLRGAGERRGWMVFNPLGFRRRVAIPFAGEGLRPEPVGEQSWLQPGGERVSLTLDLPGAGFVWVPATDQAPAAAVAPEPSLAEPHVLRNEWFEVHINETTGGIARIKGPGRSPARLSQQLNYRFSRERTFSVGEADAAEQLSTHYAEMRRLSTEVTCAGPALGEVVTEGEIVDQTNGARLAGYRQTVRVWRGRPVVEIESELNIDRMPDGEPWHNFFASRFAWHDETASLTRASQMAASEAADERIESPHYVEIATADQRTTIVAPGLPFHRKTGPRMLDTLLVVAGETRRRFRFVIALDCDYPLQAALEATTPAIVIPTDRGPPPSGAAGWYFHLDAKNVQLLALLPVLPEPGEAIPTSDAVYPAGEAGLAAFSTPGSPGNPSGQPPSGCGVRLLETEGRPGRVKLRCFRQPIQARLRDFCGKTVAPVSIEGDAVVLNLSAFELAEVELWFG